MCSLFLCEREAVEKTVEDLMKAGKPFTGRDAAEPHPEASGIEVSRYVRKMFNDGRMPGWASTQVTPGAGPVLYFKVPPRSMAGTAAAKIRRKLVAP